MPGLLHAELRARSLMTPERGIWRETSAVLGGRRVVAVCGLAASAGFYALLRALDTELVATLEYPDHYAYTQADWQIIAAAAREADLIVTTEKDLIKLERFPFPRDSLYALRLEVSMSDTDAAVLDRLIEERIAPAPSAPCDKTPAEEASRDAG
jgi:tetraacyldisaccharide 4'-kinase